MAKVPELKNGITGAMNYVRENSSESFQKVVPMAALDNIQAVAQPILARQEVMNEWLSNFVNLIVMQIVEIRRYSNPLKILKSGLVPLGQDIQESYVNLINASPYDATGSNLMPRMTPQVEVIYYRRNRQDEYKVTISQVQLRAAFTSWEKLEDLASWIIQTLYNSDEYDEFTLMKNTFGNAAYPGTENSVARAAVIKSTEIDDPRASESNAKAFVKLARKLRKDFTYASDKYNNFAALNPSIAAPLKTWCPVDRQVLIVRSDVMAEIDVEVLAQAFNLEYSSLMGSVLEVDDFGQREDAVNPGEYISNDIYGILCDRSLLRVFDNYVNNSSFYNASGLYWNYFLHHWQTYSINAFANAMAFTKKTEPGG